MAGHCTWVILVVLVAPLVVAVPRSQRHWRAEPPSGSTESYIKKINMPGVTPKVHDAYLCTAMKLNSSVEEWVVKYDPLASANRAHHMLLFGCADVDSANLVNGYWDCGHHGVCKGGRVMYAWAKNAPATSLPTDVGFRMGGQSGINYLTLQIHYMLPLDHGIKDESGLEMHVTQQKQKYKAGIYLLAGGGPRMVIPPNTPKFHGDINCMVSQSEPVDINIFAYRVHAHVLGAVITGYLYRPSTGKFSLVAKGNPHWPQAFYPTENIITVQPTDVLTARCTWNSTGRDRYTYIGSTGDDEMCNLYLMYYTDRDAGSESGGCGQESFPDVTRHLPKGNDVTLPPNPLLEEHAKGHNKHAEKEFAYNGVKGNIEVQKKAQSRKDPQPWDYDYEYQDYGFPSRSRAWQQQPQSNPNRYNPSISRTATVGSGRFVGGPGGGREYQQQQQQTSAFPKPKKLPNLNFNTNLPYDSFTPSVAQSPRTGKKLKGSAFQLVSDWGMGLEGGYGQVTAVAVDSSGDVVVFHRGERSWDGSTFKNNNKLRDRSTPISKPTLVHLAKESGQVLHQWGQNFFYVPHGMTIDKDDNIWLTDVGLHQVFKFPKQYGDGQPLITLGTKFEPGSDNTHFCKPTAVAILSTGEFFVSDGYCNARILKYDSTGKLLMQFGKPSTGGYLRNSSPAPSTFSIPHALTLAHNETELCVADRENGRVQCFTTGQGKFTRQFQFPGWGRRLFSVAYTKARGGRLYAVNGPALLGMQKVMAFEVDYSSGELMTHFSPSNQGLSNPHDLAVSDDGNEVYVVEIGPNKVWKFQLESSIKPQPTPANATKLTPTKVQPDKIEDSVKSARISLVSPSEWVSGGMWVVVAGLLAVPIIVLTTFTLVIRARRSGRLHLRHLHNGKSLNRGGKHENGLSLGSLFNSRRGFEQLATEDLDHDAPDSGDSDVEEFSQVATRA